jgi:hypothetical protein
LELVDQAHRVNPIITSDAGTRFTFRVESTPRKCQLIGPANVPSCVPALSQGTKLGAAYLLGKFRI